MITLNRTRSVLSTPALLQSLRTAVENGRTPAEAVEALREAGFRAGESFHAIFQDSLPESSDGESIEDLPAWRFWQRFSRFWSSHGWGELQHRELHPGVSVLESTDWVEAEGDHALAGCHVTTGILAELLRRVAGGEIAVLEGTCRSRGDATCSFLIGGPDALQAIHAEIIHGRSIDEAVAHLG